MDSKEILRHYITTIENFKFADLIDIYTRQISMSDFSYDYHYEVPESPYGRAYFIGVRADPRLQTPDSWAVLLFWQRADGTVVEVARIDNKEHRRDDGEGAHLHRWYREVEMHGRDYDIPVSSWEEADEWLSNGERVQRFAQQYENTHGDERVSD